jgi:ribosomal protein S18 acetylase RimI-like enzyme
MPVAKQPEWKARLATEADVTGIMQLFRLSVEDGLASPDDAAADLHDVVDFYETSDDLGRFWVADCPKNGIVGMVGVLPEQEHVAAMRRLHVHPELRQKGIGSCLVSEALQHCHDNGFVKIHLEADENQKAAIALFTRFGFSLQRTRERANRNIMEFYIDLYSTKSGQE